MVFLLLPGAAVASAKDNEQATSFSARLTGAQETPAVNTAATGRFSAELQDNDTALSFELSARGFNDQNRITQAHIHIAPRGVPGSVVVFLFPTSTNGTAGNKGVDGRNFSVSGTVTAVDMVGGATFAQLVQALRTGNAYANIHTTNHGGGEIRGQIAADD
jgi:hypothetical protein